MINGGGARYHCGTVSFIDRTPLAGAGIASCSVSVPSAANYTISVEASAAGARWEFSRGSVNNQFHAKVIGN